MQRQITRDNHYVPQWYQKGFLAKGSHKLKVLNLAPAATLRPNGQGGSEPEVEELGPKLAFYEFDLYTTRLGESLNDDIETFLFGRIDKSGADAVRAWIAGDLIKIHRKFQDFFVYMDVQKLRTPKGLDWILKQYQGLPQAALMEQMEALRQMHCTMWSECVREIVSAATSPVKFLVSDHPVTVYHPKLPPDSMECQYPCDPGVQLVGSQTIFPLDANRCLILTNLEYAEDPAGADSLSRRTNARFRGESMARTDAFIRGRELGEAQVNAVNRVLKSRAKKYVAASNLEWLYPERHCTLPWADIGKILLPQSDLWRFGGEMYIGYEDGTSAYRDKFGRTSKAHESLTKPPLTEDTAPDAQCGCGSGIAFRDCCADVAPQMRPSWRVMGIRERSLALVHGINQILRLNEDKSTWLDVRRNLSDGQVRHIHELYAGLWPMDTRLIDLLPSPQSRRSRALYLGMTDPRMLSTAVTGMLAYVDEIVLAHPFVNANAVRPEFSPIHNPAHFRSQTLRDVFALMILEPDITAGRIHLVPDPLDFEPGFRQEIVAIAKRSGDKVKLGPIDEALSKVLSRDEMMRAIKRLPPAELKRYIKCRIPKGAESLTDADADLIGSLWKREMEDDPLALLDPLTPGDGGQFKILKGFAREAGLYVATLTGSLVYTDSDTQWERLHETDGVRHYAQDPLAKESIRCLESLIIKVPSLTYHHEIEPPGSSGARSSLRKVAIGLREGVAPDVSTPPTKDQAPSPDVEGLLTFKLRASAPLNGFQRTDVSRLVVTYGRLEDVAPVRLGLFLEPVDQAN